MSQFKRCLAEVEPRPTTDKAKIEMHGLEIALTEHDRLRTYLEGDPNATEVPVALVAAVLREAGWTVAMPTGTPPVPDLAPLFVAMRKRETLTAYLDGLGIEWREQPDASGEGLSGISFEPDGEERWLARFWPSGSFRDLVWG